MSEPPTRPKLYASADSFLDPVLSNTWLAVAMSDDVGKGVLVPVTLMGVDLVLWRDGEGAVHAWEDFCIHRGVKLSLGHVRDDTVVCPYHAWAYDGTGRCTLIPAHPDLTPPERARANVLPVTERYGLVWTSLGTPAGEPPPVVCWDDPVFSTKALCGPYVFEAAAQRADPEVGERFSLAIRSLLFESGLDPSAPEALAGLLADHGIAPSAVDADAVRSGWDEGRERGVVGSPYFFAGDRGWFCPSLDIHHDDDGWEVGFDAQGLDAFLATVFDA